MVFATALKLRLTKWLQTIMVEAKCQGPSQTTTAISVSSYTTDGSTVCDSNNLEDVAAKSPIQLPHQHEPTFIFHVVFSVTHRTMAAEYIASYECF